jgi:hypothetical protein
VSAPHPGYLPERRPSRALAALRWHYRRRAARRAAYYADLEYRRSATSANLARLIRARDLERRLDLNRPT